MYIVLMYYISIDYILRQLRNRIYLLIYFVSGILKNKRINMILPQILVIVITYYLILHVSLLLYSYCENVER